MSVEVTQADIDCADRANIIWAEASGGPSAAAIAATLSRIEAERGALERAKRVAESYRYKMAALVVSSSGDDDLAASACWHAAQIRNEISSLMGETHVD